LVRTEPSGVVNRSSPLESRERCFSGRRIEQSRRGSIIAEETLRLAAAFWWLWLLVVLVAAAKLTYRVYESRRLARSGINEVDVMDGKTFERYLAMLFQQLGYYVEQTRYRGDYGCATGSARRPQLASGG
jgi:HJR/Mrr/RecB family endonuclease